MNVSRFKMDVLFLSPKQANKKTPLQYVIILLRAIIYLSQLKTFKLQINKRYDSKAIKKPVIDRKRMQFFTTFYALYKIEEKFNLYNYESVIHITLKMQF